MGDLQQLRNAMPGRQGWVSAVRLHHRLVLIHPFPKRLYWGDGNLVDITDLRKRYIDALHAADASNYTALLEFVYK